MYNMVLHIFDIDHCLALLAFADVTAAVSFVEVDLVARELFLAVCARLGLVF